MASAVSSSSINYPKIATEVINEISKIPCTNDIISDLEIKTTVAENYQFFKQRYLDLLRSELHVTKARAACSQSAEALKDPLRKYDYPSARIIAITKFNIRKCHESTVFIATSLAKRGFSSHIISFQNPKNPRLNHAFNLIGVSNEDCDQIFSASQLITSIFEKIKTGYLIDSYLNYHGPTSEYEHSFIARYNNARGIDTLVQYGPYTANPAASEQTEQQSLQIYEMAKTIYPTVSIPVNFQFLNEFLTKKQQEIADTLLPVLNKMNPQIVWKKSTKDGVLTLWTQGSQAEMEKISKDLIERKFFPKMSQIKNKETFCVQLINPEPQ